MKSFFLALSLCLISAASASADPVAEELAALRGQVQQLTGMIEQLHTTVSSQQERIQSLEGERLAQASSSAAVVPARPAATPFSAQSLNPDIGVVADIVAQSSESAEDAEGNDRISAREVELVFGHAIDPYSRLDVTVALSDFEEASLEEAYVTHWGLPAEIKTRVGKLRPKISKAGAVHRDSLETVDEPLFVQRYLGAEGLSRAALELSGFLPFPWTAVTHELTAGFMEGGVGEGANLLGQTRRRPSFYTHIKNFWDISEFSSVELGATHLAGSSDADSSVEVNALGLDATLTHFVTPANKLKWQSELFLQDRDEHISVETDAVTGEETTTFFAENPWGWYSLLDYRLSPRFGIGGRLDYVELINVDPAVRVRSADTAWSGYLTFYQSEFARWRLQLKHTDFAQGGDDNTVFVQGTMAIGVHKHQIQ